MSGDNGETRKWVNTAANVSKADSLKRMADASQARAEAALRKQLMEEERLRQKEEAEYQAWLDSLVSRKDQKSIQDSCYAQVPEIFVQDNLRKWHVRDDFLESLKSPRQKWLEDNQIGFVLLLGVGVAIGFVLGLIMKMMSM